MAGTQEATIGRRTILASGLGALAAAQRPARAPAGRTLRFVPQSDLAGFDPVANTSTAIRNNGDLIFDTL